MHPDSLYVLFQSNGVILPGIHQKFESDAVVHQVGVRLGFGDQVFRYEYRPESLERRKGYLNAWLLGCPAPAQCEHEHEQQHEQPARPPVS
jgi:hypothetical protein